MTQDILMSSEESVAPTNDSAHKQLQQFCLLAKTAHGAAILELIKQALEASGVYVFGELLAMPNVQELKTGDNVKYFNTLNLFAYGTYKQYRQQPLKYLELTPAMQKKLQHLTIVSLAIKNKCIPYEVLLEELEIDNVRHLEDVIIEAIYADIIHGKLFQNNRFLEIDYAQGRDIPPGYTAKIAETLQDWIDSCDAISNCIVDQIKLANAEKSKKLDNKKQIEQEIINLKKVLKTQINDNDDAMQIDSRETSSTSQEARKKTSKVKPSRSTDVLNAFFYLWYKFNKDNIILWIGTYLNILITNAKDIEFILSSPTLLNKSDVYDIMHPWLGEGLLTSSGSKWHKHRKMITPSFHFKILQDFHEVMNTNSNKFVGKLRDIAKGEAIFDLQAQTYYFTLDVICETAMGVHINAMDSNDSELVSAFKHMCYNINMRAFHPLKRNPFIYKFYPDYRKFCKTLKILQDFTYEVIEKRIQSRKHNEAEKSENEDDEFSNRKLAFLDTLLSSTVDGKPLTVQEVYEEVSTFMFEGHDTTASAITFTLYLLSRHLGVQAKVFEEQRKVMLDNLKRDATYQEIAEMKFLDLVVKESLRLYPSVPVIGRIADKDYNINGKQIPKGCSLNIFLMALGYNETTFPEPYRFMPERFEVANKRENANAFDYVPFSAGPRNCIGQKFAQLEIKTVVSKIVRNFDILPALDELASKDGFVTTRFGSREPEYPQHKYEPLLSAELTLKSANGVYLRMKERS